MSKIQNESNSQPKMMASVLSSSCKTICQRYKMKAIHNKRKYITPKIKLQNHMSKIQNESNSQLARLASRPHSGCKTICQRYKMKAIHNGSHNSFTIVMLQNHMSKIQNESNSQHDGTKLFSELAAKPYVKDTKIAGESVSIFINPSLRLTLDRNSRK